MPSLDKQAVEAGEEADMVAEYEETGDDGVIENETPERLLLIHPQQDKAKGIQSEHVRNDIKLPRCLQRNIDIS